jgi:hypothetical protein
LLGGLEYSDVPQPLGMFQHTRPNEVETKKMLDAINEAINPDEPPNLDRLFERMWPDLQGEINNMPSPETNVPTRRPLEDMVAETLNIVRGNVLELTREEWQRQLAKEVSLLDFQTEGMSVADLLTTRLRYRLACSECGSRDVRTDEPNHIKCLKCGSVNVPKKVLDMRPPDYAY